MFAKDDRWISNGCVRLEDYRRFATWVFGADAAAEPAPASRGIDLPRPVPVYMTYLTVAPRGNGVVFRPDPYGFDALAMPQMFGPGTQLASLLGTAARPFVDGPCQRRFLRGLVRAEANWGGSDMKLRGLDRAGAGRWPPRVRPGRTGRPAGQAGAAASEPAKPEPPRSRRSARPGTAASSAASA